MSAPHHRPLASSSPVFYADWSLAPVWMLLCATLLAGAWLQPNHYLPWPRFHADTWLGCAALLLTPPLFWTARKTDVIWHATTISTFVLALFVSVQHAFGVISSGQAFVTIGYFLGFAFAMMAGSACEVSAQRDRALDILFLGIGIAGLVSFLIQLWQWLYLPAPFFWVMEGGNDRPYANLGQPNQLATLLSWSVVASLWGMARGHVRVSFGRAVALVFIFGVALTRSRTGMLELLLVMGGVWVWRRHFSIPRLGLTLASLVVAFAAFSFASPYVANAWLYGSWNSSLSPILDAGTGLMRLQIYELVLEASVRRPLLGYGWENLQAAQLALAEDYPVSSMLFMHAHNLVLDIVGSTGWLLGAPLIIFAAWWAVRILRSVRNAEESILCLMLMVVGVHAMLELPLYYGYFLWITGFCIGLLNRRFNLPGLHQKSIGLVLCLWLVCGSMLGLVIRDYLLAEEEYRITRFEALRVGKTPPGPRPTMWVLTQMDDLVWIARLDVRPGMSKEDMERLQRVVQIYPSLPGMIKTAEALAYNGQPEKASLWLRRMQRVLNARMVDSGRDYWNARYAGTPELASVPWPY